MIACYYRDFGMRVIGDVDILIPKCHVEKAVSILNKAGWKAKDPRFNPQFRAWHAMDFTLDQDTHMDLHWSLIFESVADIDEVILQDAQPVTMTNLNLYIPNPADLLLQTCVHGMKHSPVPLIRWIADAMIILQHSQIDWERLVELAKKTHVSLPLYNAFHYLNTHFSAAIPDKVIKELSNKQFSRLEHLERWCKERDFFIGMSWCRYCIREGYVNLGAQIISFPCYLKEAARLRYLWQVPFYSVYWLGKRLYRLLTT